MTDGPLSTQWRYQILNTGSAAMAVASVLGVLAVTLTNPDIWKSTEVTLSAIALVASIIVIAIWRTGPFQVRAGALIVLILGSILLFLSWVGYTAAPALAGIVPVLLAGLLFGLRWALATWLASIAIMFTSALAIQQGIVPSQFDPAVLNPQDLSFGLRYTMTYSIFSVIIAVGTAVVVDRLNRSLASSRQAMEANEASQAQWASLAENAPDLILIVDAGHHIEFRNRALLGFETAVVLGSRVEDFLDDEQARLVKGAIDHVFASGATAELEVSINNAAGETTILSTRLSPIKQGEQVHKVTLIASDVTHQRSLEAQLQQAQKLEAIGRLAAGVAHDFNNILMIIRGRADLIELKAAPGNEEVLKDVQTIAESAERGAQLTRQLLAFGRMNPQAIETVDLNSVTRHMTDLLERLVGATYDLEVQTETDEALVDCDPSTFQQILTNLIINARDAMPAGGKITIRLQHLALKDNPAEHHDLSPGDYISVAVIDKGVGMDAGVQAKIFEPFYTTKSVGVGTGLGLSMAYGAVRDWGGNIVLTSEVGTGTCIEMLLPRSERPVS